MFQGDSQLKVFGPSSVLCLIHMVHQSRSKLAVFRLTHLGHQYGFQHDCCAILLWSSFCIIFVTFENIVNNSTVLVLVAEHRKMRKIVSATDKVIIVCVCTQKSTGWIQPWRVSSLLVMATTPRLVASKFKVQLRC